MKEKVSVVITSLKKKEEMICFPYLLKQTYPSIEVIARSDPGVSLPKNRAIESANGGIIAFLDDDARPPCHWVERIVMNLREKKGLVGRVIDESGTIFSSIPEHYDQGDTCHMTRVGTGCNMAFRREVFDVVGVFDEYYHWGYEENDFFHRYLEEFDLWYCPDVYVYHEYAESFQKYMKKRFKCGKSDLHYWGKNGYPFLSQGHQFQMNLGSQLRLTTRERLERRLVKLIGWYPECCGILYSLMKG